MEGDWKTAIQTERDYTVLRHIYNNFLCIKTRTETRRFLELEPQKIQSEETLTTKNPKRYKQKKP
jgi:hypothetical protein